MPAVIGKPFRDSLQRVEEWCGNAKRGWGGDDLAGDAFLNFTRKLSTVATFDLSKLGIHNGSWGEFQGLLNADTERLEIHPRRHGQGNWLRGLWFHLGVLATRRLASFRRYSGVWRGLRGKGCSERWTAAAGLNRSWPAGV